MKAIMLMFDSLNRHMLPNYGCDWVKAPNFKRLAARTVQFENSYAGSLPCIPARRELHTGRYNFLHRSWGPLEPFDDSMPALLRDNGVHSHLATDHWHYFSTGGAMYNTRYSTWEFCRGQMGDPWKGQVREPEMPEDVVVAKEGRAWRQNWVNREHMPNEEDHHLAKTVGKGVEFMEMNKDEDNWFCQIECFDPHEPFFSPQAYKDLYPHDYDGRFNDCPPYKKIHESPEEVAHVRYEYAALVSMCDAYLGRVLDKMDELDLWDDTMLIVNTDHGFLLGEHGWWAKGQMPWYQELAHTPLLIWDPRSGRQGVRCDSLVQTIDLPATLLDFFGIERPKDMQGIPLKDALADGAPVHDAILFGTHGRHVHCTDGHYHLMVAPGREPNYEYTLMPTHMWKMFAPSELALAELAEPFEFTKGCPVMRVPADAGDAERGSFAPHDSEEMATSLFDLEVDPREASPIDDAEIEAQMRAHMARLMRENEAPAELFARMGLEAVPT